MQIRVLLVDDDSEDQEIFIQQLAQYNPGIEVISAFNGKDALNMLSRTNPNYIFLDINMPGLNGMEVLKKIKETKAVKDIPVVMYSTSDGFRHKPNAFALGVMQYFRKPHSEHGFLRMFKEVFNRN